MSEKCLVVSGIKAITQTGDEMCQDFICDAYTEES